MGEFIDSSLCRRFEVEESSDISHPNDLYLCFYKHSISSRVGMVLPTRRNFVRTDIYANELVDETGDWLCRFSAYIGLRYRFGFMANHSDHDACIFPLWFRCDD